MIAGDPGILSALKKGLGKLKKIPGLGTGLSLAASFIPGGGLVAKGIGLAGKLGKAKKIAGIGAGIAGLVGAGAGGAVLARRGMSSQAGFTDPFGQALGTPGATSAEPSGFAGLFGGGAGGRRRGRRMNPANIRALRRSIRRVKAFSKIARQSVVIASKVKAKKRGR